MARIDTLRFIKRTTLFIILLALADQLIGYGVNKFYFKQKKGAFAQITYAIDSTRSDVLILGSSKALHHYVSPVISKGLNLSVYNCGNNGQQLPYSAAILKLITERYQPKIIIVDMLLWDFGKGDDKFDRLSVLLPYYSAHPGVLPYINQNSQFERLKLISKSYPFNSFLLPGLYNYFLAGTLLPTQNGYLPLNRTLSKAQYSNTLQALKKTTFVISKKVLPFMTNAPLLHIKIC
jgi:hypothetical protein